DRCFVAAKNLPGQAYPGLKGRPIPVDARRITNTILPGNEKLARAASLGDVVGHALIDFRDGTGEIPRQTKIERQIFSNSPIILNEWAEDFPAAAGDRTIECLIVLRDTHQAEQEIRLSVTGNVHSRARKAAEITDGGRDPESVLEGLRAHIHLVRAYRSSHLDVMFAPNQVEGIAEREDVGSALERREAAIAEGPKGAKKERRNQPAAVGARGTGCAAATTQVRARYTELCRLATPGALGSDVVENPVVTKAGLVHRGGGKHVSLPDGYLARVIENSLVAAERVRFGKRASPAAARHIGNRLVVAKTSERVVGAREVVVQTNVELGFVELAHGLANEVESRSQVIGVWRGVVIHQGLPDVVNQAGWNFVTGSSVWLESVGVCGQRVPCRIAMEIDIGKDGWVCRGPDHVWIDDYHTGSRIAKGVGAEIAGAHRYAGKQSRKCDAMALIFLLAIDEEERLILSNRSTDRPAKLIQVELFRRGRKEALGIQ